MTERPQALIYCRVSTRSQTEDGASLQSQEAACRRMAAQLGYDVGRVTHEVYSGAELWDRPQLSIDRADIKAGRFAALIALDVDRLSRDPIHFAIIAQECGRADCDLHLVNAPLDTSPEGMLIAYVKGYAAQIERAKIKERSLRGKRYRLEQGKVLNAGPDLYGFRRDKERGTRIIHEPEAAIVRRIFRAYVTERGSLRALARQLTAEGVPSPGADKYRRTHEKYRAKPEWGASQLAYILRNPAYKGETVAWTIQYDMRTKKHQHRPESEHVHLPEGTTPALVDAAMWDAAQRRLKSNFPDTTRNARRPYLLRGMISCLHCDKPRHASMAHRNRRYRCSSVMIYGGSCGSATINADDVETDVWRRVEHALAHPDVITAELARQADRPQDSLLASDLHAAHGQLAQVTRQIDRLLGLYARADDGAIPEEDLRRQISERTEARKHIERTIAELEARIAAQGNQSQARDAVAAYIRRVAENMKTLDFDGKRAVLEALGIHVRGNGSTWRVYSEFDLPGLEFVPEDGVSCVQGTRPV